MAGFKKDGHTHRRTETFSFNPPASARCNRLVSIFHSHKNWMTDRQAMPALSIEFSDRVDYVVLGSENGLMHYGPEQPSIQM